MSWRPTRAQIEAAGAGPFVAGRPWTYRQIFVDKTARIPFEDEEYDAENEGLDPKGGLEYVWKLAALMKARVPLPPALGFPDTSEPGIIHLTDGNHRVAAAVLLGHKKIPVIVYDALQPRWPEQKRSSKRASRGRR